MPSDFYMALKADIKRCFEYEPLANYVWESPTSISISAYEKGEIRIEYASTVTTITSSTPDTYEFEISEQAQNAMIVYVTAMFVQKEDYSQYQLLMSQYIDIIANIKNDVGLQKKQRNVKRIY
jgi:hypothetical protein